MKFTTATVLAALVCLAVEVPEGADADQLLDSTLDGYGLTRDQFLTESTLFSLGYHRGLQSKAFGDDQVPLNAEGKPDAASMTALESGYAFGLEARELQLVPPASLVFEASRKGKVQNGSLSTWAQGLKLAKTSRLSHAVTFGSGKNLATVPAGTPVDVIKETTKDGQPAIIVAYDGVALIIPNPESDPCIVSGDTVVQAAKAPKKARKSKDGTEAKPKGPPAERGPTLKGVIIGVIEGTDGGPGPLQTNGQFASRVMAQAMKLGIGDKAQKFVQNAEKHVPYYLNCYGPDSNGHTNRLGVEKPKNAVMAQIKARRYFLAAGDVAVEERMKAIPAEISALFADLESVTETTPAPAKAKAEAAEPAEVGEQAAAEAK